MYCYCAEIDIDEIHKYPIQHFLIVMYANLCLLVIMNYILLYSLILNLPHIFFKYSA